MPLGQMEPDKKVADDARPDMPGGKADGLRPSEMALRRLRLYGRETGWLRSHALRQSIGAAGEPVPWYTYGAVYFLAQRVKPHFKVFEFGSGNSTLWWASRVERVISVDHNRAWYERIKGKMPANVELHYFRKQLGGDYCRTAERTGLKFDVLVIDGADRNNCAEHSLGSLADNGIIIWDNSERPHYVDALQGLEMKGFRRLPFYGHGPVAAKHWETAIFYRPNNCLGI